MIDHASKPQNDPILRVFDPNDLEDVGQGHPYSIGVKNLVRYIFCANLVQFHPIVFDLRCGQTQNAPILSVLRPNDLGDEGQGQP